MTSADNLEFLRQENRRYIIGTNKALLKKFEQELFKQDWHTIREGIEVKLCKMPKDEDSDSTDEVTETFILCRSQDRKEKDKAIVQRAADKIAERLASMKARCEKQNRSPLIVSREIGRLLGQNTRASHLFEINVLMKDKKFALIEWKKNAFERTYSCASCRSYFGRRLVNYAKGRGWETSHVELFRNCRRSDW